MSELRQGYAEGICTTFRLRADFDLVVGCDVRSAVRRVASAQLFAFDYRTSNCRIMAASGRGGYAPATGELADSLSLLALPEAAELDVPEHLQRARILPWKIRFLTLKEPRETQNLH